MCGRFTVSVTLDELKQYLYDDYDIEEVNNDFNLPRFNVAPGQSIISIINDRTKNRVGLLKWGFIPSFAKDEKTSLNIINAKAETLHQKPAFITSFQSKRCVIIADGFYEWKKSDDKKTPMHIQLKDKKLFPMAGLWNTFTKDDGTKIHTCAIITTKANDMMSTIHDRMPVILSEDSRKSWLNPDNKDLNELSRLLNPYDSNQMESYQVSNIVNNASNDVPDCIKHI
ncbi:MAG: SOS response-associated peptidase [Tenericutes bacterium]|nr:SOS response-associated peptidase [Mycoplasmatota bacterium]